MNSRHWKCKHPYKNLYPHYIISITLNATEASCFSLYRNSYTGALSIESSSGKVISNLSMKENSLTTKNAENICFAFATELQNLCIQEHHLIRLSIKICDSPHQFNINIRQHLFRAPDAKYAISLHLTNFLQLQASKYKIDRAFSSTDEKLPPDTLFLRPGR